MSANDPSNRPANDPDNLERRLHDLLHSRRLSVDPAPDTLDRIHAGARRRQQRHRIATSALSAVAVVAVVAVGVVLHPTHHTGTSVADGARSTSPSDQAGLNGAATATPSSGSAQSSASVSTPPSASALGSASSASTIAAGGAPPSGFVPISVTAVNDKTFWVLGHAPCASQTCTGLAKTTDGGKTFTEVGAPPSALVPDVPGNNDVFGTDTISDVRFVDSNDGWAYGGGLWETTDGGQHWSAVEIPGSVQKLEVASGRAWAIVFGGAAASLGPSYHIYTATYPGGSWELAESAGTFGPAEPALAVQGNSAIVIGTDAGSGKLLALVAAGSATFGAVPGAPPCGGAPGEPLSSSADSIWLACTSSSDTLPGVFLSSDFGQSWRTASSTLADASGASGASVAIGAVDAKSAIVSAGGRLERVGADGSTEHVSQPSIPPSTVFSFVGFTTPSIGFAIPEIDKTRQVWRSTDGGSHWSVVKI